MAAALSMASMTLGELLGPEARAHAGIAITDLVMDHRDVTPGAAFVALSGRRFHGLDFAQQARSSGAVVVLYEPSERYRDVPEPSLAMPGLKNLLGQMASRFYGRRELAPMITGITGTNGKTTVAMLVAQSLNRLHRTCGYIGTLGYGIPPELAPHRHTTPDCLTLHREIAMQPVSDVILEVSSHALAQDRTAGVPIRAAVFTNLTRDHLDEHGDVLGYQRAKATLFGLPGVDRAVLNIDDSFGATLAAALKSRLRIIGVSLKQDRSADLLGSVAAAGFEGMTVEIAGPDGEDRITSRLIGEFNAQNLVLSLGALMNLGVPQAAACRALEQCAAPPGRMDVFPATSTTPTVVVDYAHTPDALARVLDAIRALAAGNVWCVFGCGGDRDTGKRALMGAAAGQRADHIVLTDDNPRSESPAEIVAEIRSGIAAGVDVYTEHDRHAAIARAIADAAPQDVVLIAGKGHESRQQFADGDRPFDDRATAARILGFAP